MRLAVFSESYEPIINGVSVCVSTLRDGLQMRGDEVTIFAPKYPGYVDSFDSVYRLPALRTIVMPTYPIPVPNIRIAKRQMRKTPFDIIHTQTPFILGMVALRLGIKYNIPVVSTNHTLYTEYAHYFPLRPKSLTKKILKTHMKRYYNQCSAVVVPSEPVAQMLRSYGVKTRLEVIKTGVNPIGENLNAAERSAVRKRMMGSAEGKMLLYVGRVAREKNINMMLRAVMLALEANIDVRLLVVGGGPSLSDTEDYAHSIGFAKDRIKFTGMMQRDDIRELYEAADLFVFPSTTETQGIAICEAMTAGLPVVAVNAGGIPENVTDGEDGYLTNDSHEEFAQRIIELLKDDSKRESMGEMAMINSARFTIDYMIDQMQALYRSVIK